MALTKEKIPNGSIALTKRGRYATLFCYDVAGRQGVELIVNEEDTCENFVSWCK